MSSNDRQPRRRSTPPPAQAEEVYYEDDVFYGGDWREEETYEDEIVDYGNQQAPAQRGGTAAGLNRLRQSLGRDNDQSVSREPAPAARQAPRRQASEAPRYAEDELETLNQPVARSRRSSSEGVQPSRQPEPAYELDDGYEPYDEYEDDFSEYDAPPRQRQPRSRPQVSVPTIKRPTMPAAIANADLVSDVPALSLIGTSIVSLVAMAILVGNQAGSLAPDFPTHVSASGVLEDFRSESALWRLPLLATAFTLMNVAIAWFTSPIDRFASRFVLAAAILVQFIAWVAVIRIL